LIVRVLPEVRTSWLGGARAFLRS